MSASASARPDGQVIVIGAGVGGLAAAIRLRAAGLSVTLLERAATPGGKMRELEVGGLPIDAGPSVLTMPWVFEELFACAGARLAEWVRLVPVAPLCRHFFPDGVVLDLHADERGDRESDDRLDERRVERSAAEIERVLGRGARDEYLRFRRYAEAMFRAVRRPFLEKALPSTRLYYPFHYEWRDLIALLRVDSGRSVWQALAEHFQEPHLRVLFARYATYAGSDPFRAPATLNVIPHVELSMGVFSIEGGMYRLALAMAGLAERLGVRLCFSAEAERIELCPRERRALAVHCGGERLPCDAVVANCDVPHLFSGLLAGTRRGARLAEEAARHPPSLSAHLLLAAVRGADELPLSYHNVFFSPDYPREFAELAQGRVPEDPTLYQCAPDGSRWFFLVNAPPLPEAGEESRAGAGAGPIRERVRRALARHRIDLDRHVAAELEITPQDFAARFPESRGALYGIASNTRAAAFRRPPNRVRGLANLYCVGGSTHPGAGVPMVALSARISAGLLIERLRRGKGMLRR